MPPLLRAADSMNSSSATAIPDTSKRTLRSQASLEIEAILSGAGARGDDAEFMRMIHGQQQQLAGGMGMSSQGTMVDELHPQPGAIGARGEAGPTRGKGGEKKSRRERERSVLRLRLIYRTCRPSRPFRPCFRVPVRTITCHPASIVIIAIVRIHIHPSTGRGRVYRRISCAIRMIPSTPSPIPSRIYTCRPRIMDKGRGRGKVEGRSSTR